MTKDASTGPLRITVNKRWMQPKVLRQNLSHLSITEFDKLIERLVSIRDDLKADADAELSASDPMAFIDHSLNEIADAIGITRQQIDESLGIKKNRNIARVKYWFKPKEGRVQFWSGRGVPPSEFRALIDANVLEDYNIVVTPTAPAQWPKDA